MVLNCPPTAGATEEHTMEVKDKAHGKMARVILEQVVEGIAVPGQLFLVADAKPLIGTADDALSSRLLDDDPLDS